LQRLASQYPSAELFILTERLNDHAWREFPLGSAFRVLPKTIELPRLVALLAEFACRARADYSLGACNSHSARPRKIPQAQMRSPKSRDLSRRESEILHQVSFGKSNKQIAYSLNLREKTIKNHMTSILHKLGMTNRTQAAMYAMRTGWGGFGSDVPSMAIGGVAE
jgi:DNA-binding NarL/FixJ family response regulator